MIRPRRVLSWTPRRRGDVFCSSACGRGCTAAEHAYATGCARALVRKLGGKGWRVRVWENLGWHWSAVSICGRLKVHPSDGSRPQGSYSAFLGEADSLGGTWCATARSPRAAIRAVIADGQAHVDALAALLVDLPPVR